MPRASVLDMKHEAGRGIWCCTAPSRDAQQPGTSPGTWPWTGTVAREDLNGPAVVTAPCEATCLNVCRRLAGEADAGIDLQFRVEPSQHELMHQGGG